MPKRDLRLYIQDIFESIEAIESYITEMVQTLKQPINVDGRNQYDPEEVKEAGFEYHGIGREII